MGGSHGQEAKRGEAGIASRGMVRRWVVSPPVCTTGLSLIARGCLIGVTSSGSAVDVCSDAPTGALRAERAADGGVVYISQVLSVSPRASRINA